MSKSELIEPDPDESKTFSNLLARMEEGILDRDLSEAWKALIKNLRDTQLDQGGKPVGEISLSIKFKLDDGMVETRSEMKVKAPKQPRSRALFWPTEDGTLTLRNPRQRNLPFGVRDIRSPDTRDVG